MKIGIDARYYFIKGEGFGTYVKNIINSLALIDKQNQYLLYVNGLPKNFKSSLLENFKFVNIPSSFFWQQIRLPLHFLTHYKPDIFFSPIQTLPFYCNAKTVVTVHDLAFLKFPEYFKKKNKFLLEKLTYSAINKAKKIIADSQSTKKDLISYYKITADKIKVIYLGTEKKYQKTDENLINKIKNKYQINNDYFLFVGVIQPRKNIERLIKAFNLLIKSYQQEIKLIIVGKKGWMFEKIFKTAEKLSLQDKVIFLDYVSNEDLAVLYNNAKVFVFPSLYEGFGLPVLEALSYGVPVITSNTSSMPEICGDAALYVNPYNVKEITEAIKKILTDEKLSKELSQKALKQAQLFNWQKSAQELLEVFNTI